ncbi:centrosomal protein of 104 kDa [Lycorma delicatula]|uniref:centrosomal protein of 104 kDa n=1 Tax=Lycorma delicatula TaxID=130591 RepID=UPI003F513F91
MPRKISFSVIYATGEEEKYKASELDHHGPSVRGWQSCKDCNYPQELILKLHVVATLQQIQILAHQFLISERIDLWIGPEREDNECEPNSLRYDYLGYITLSDNMNTDYKSRELKSITVPPFRSTSYIKLRLHKNHRNIHNIYNQVSIVAIQLIGDDAQINDPLIESVTGININDSPNKAHYMSVCDDLAFEMYVDKDVARIIRLLEIRKHQAVQDERFEYARKLKSAMAELRLAGERLGKLEIGKKQAIQNEDYIRAKRKKAQMDEYRKEVYTILHVSDLLEENGMVPKNDEESPDDADKETSDTIISEDNLHTGVNFKAKVPISLPPTTPQIQTCQPPVLPTPIPQPPVTTQLGLREGVVSPGLYQSPVSPLHYTARTGATSPTGSTMMTKSASAQPVRSGSLRRRNKSAGPARNSYEAYDERTVPAQRNVHTADTVRDTHLPSSGTNVTTTHSKLNERERKQAALPISVFGMALVEKFYSKQFTDKEEGLRLLEAALRSYVRAACVKPPDHVEVHSPNKVARAAIFLLHRTLRDKVFLVYSVSAEVIRYFFHEFVPGRVTMAEVSRSVDKLLPELISKSGDTTPRIHNMAVHTILSMADTRDVRSLHIIPVHLTRVLTSSTHPRLAQSRLEMAEQLILNHGISSDKNSGMTCRTLAEFGASGLHHPAEAVRKVAERVLLLVYKVNPRIVRKQLPPDDDITRRNLLYRHLYQQFDKIDSERKQSMCEKNKLVRSDSANSTNPITTTRSSHAISSINTTTSGNTTTTNSITLTSNTATNPHSRDSPGSHSSSSSSGQSFLSPSVEQQQDKQCIFCLTTSESFTEEGLNIHYWKECPMLMRCHHCQEVVEIATLNQHLTVDCDRRKYYIKCDNCGEAVLRDQVEEHKGSTYCSVGIKCPLCFMELTGDDSCWREHLAIFGPNLCINHPRRGYVKQINRVQSPEL